MRSTDVALAELCCMDTAPFQEDWEISLFLWAHLVRAQARARAHTHTINQGSISEEEGKEGCWEVRWGCLPQLFMSLLHLPSLGLL